MGIKGIYREDVKQIRPDFYLDLEDDGKWINVIVRNIYGDKLGYHIIAIAKDGHGMVRAHWDGIERLGFETDGRDAIKEL